MNVYELTDRQKRVVAFALRRFIQDSNAAAYSAGQDLNNRFFKPGDLEGFLKDAKDTAECLRIFEGEQ